MRSEREQRRHAVAFNAVAQVLRDDPHYWLPFSVRQAITDGVLAALDKHDRETSGPEPGPCCDYPNQGQTDDGETVYLNTCACICHVADDEEEI